MLWIFYLYICRQYRQQIKDFLHTLVQSKSSLEEDATASSLILEVWDNKDNSKDQEMSISVEINISSNNDSINENNDIICNSLFTIDRQPKLTDDLDIPTYGKVCHSYFLHIYLLVINELFLLSLYLNI